MLHDPNLLNPHLTESLAAVALRSIGREYPNKLDHIMTGPQDVRSPHELHPIFYGSFDWHSCVHGYWTLARLRRLHDRLGCRAAIEAHFDSHLTEQAVDAEVQYFLRPASRGFERPYGWAWLLALADELSRADDAAGRRWHEAILPLARLIADRFRQFLPVCTYPIRAGTHGNTAFAITLAHGYAGSHADGELRSLIEAAALRWYEQDANCPGFEPSLDDFLSPALMEAECMRHVLPPEPFERWLERFLPRLASGEPVSLFRPAIAGDPTDGKIVHLDGLNLSRAWCMRGLAQAATPARERLLQAAAEHLRLGLSRVRGDYMGEHWLATFALLAAGPIES